MNKQNIGPLPCRQGILYTISTGKNNGVYLPKDIAHDNHKSLTLLTNQARQAHKSYVTTLQFINKQPENVMNNSKGLCQVESFVKSCQFFEKNLKALTYTSNEISLMQKHLRFQFDRLNDRISNQNIQVHNSCLPALKNLREKIKGYKTEQSAIFSKIKRQIESMEQGFLLIGKGISQCTKKMSSCEEMYGYSKQDND